MSKHLQKFSLLLLACLWFGSSGAAFGQTFYEPFPGTGEIGGTGTTAGSTSNGWTTHSGSGTIPILTGSLSYPGLLASQGNRVLLPGPGVSRDVNAPLNIPAGTQVVYYSALVKVIDNTQLSSTGFDYFMHIGTGAGSSAGSFIARLNIKNANSGANYRLAVQNTTGGTQTQTEVPTDLNFGETYLVVVKYDLNGSDPDMATLWVNPTTLGGAEPTAGGVTNSSGTTNASSFGSIALRNSSGTPKAEIDEIRVGTTFASVAPSSQSDMTAPTLVSTTPANGATNVPTRTDVVLTFSEPVMAGTGNVTLTWSGGTLTRPANHTDNTYSESTVTIKNVVLQPNTTYTAQIENTAFKDASGNFYAGLTGNALSFTTSALATPLLTATPNTIVFPATAFGKDVVGTYDLSAMDLRGNVTVTVNGPFEISKTNGSFSSNPLTFTQAELAADKRVYVRFNSTAGTTDYTGTIVHTTEGAQAATVTLTGYGFNPYMQNFNDPNFLASSGWSQLNLAGPTNRWSYSTMNPRSAPGSATINGFTDAVPSNDWLISPALDLSTMPNFAVLSFYARKFFGGPGLKLFVSTTYNGSGTINMTDWTELNVEFPTETGVWTQLQGINLTPYKSAATYIAFVYQTTGTGNNNAAEWKIDDVVVESKAGSSLIPTNTLTFTETAPNTTSASQNFRFNTLGYGDITVTAPAGFQVSTDNTTFTSTVVVPEASAQAGTTLYVRFAPTTRQGSVSGMLMFAGTLNNFSANGPMVTGSSILRAETFDVATYNMEFFGNGTTIPGFGPSNSTLQITNATTVLNTLNVDLVGVQEISNEAAVDQVITNLPAGYAKRISPVFSYSIKPNNSTEPFPDQKIGFIYNTATVTPVGFRVMFESMYRAAVGGANNGITDDFWSSGRLPHMGTFDVTVNGITKRIRVINIHAKSGSATADFNRRKEDIRILKDSLDTYYSQNNVILLGDFNDNVFGSINSGGVSSYNSFVTDVNNYKVLTYTLAQNGGFSFPSSNSFLDHILISNELVDDYLEGSILIEDPREYVASYSSTTSDHLPVLARFAFTANDPLGVKADFKAGFRVSPNPTSGDVKLRLPAGVAQERVTVTVYSLRGDIILQATGSEQALNEKLSQKLGSVAGGMYLVKVQAGNQSFQTRIIKR